MRGEEEAPPAAAGELPQRAQAEALLERSRGLLSRMHAEDVEEPVALHERIAASLVSGDAAELAKAVAALRELLFFVEGK